MPVATPETYFGTPGETIYAGIAAPAPPPDPPADSLGSVSIRSEDANVPFETEGQIFALSLHASGGGLIATSATNGRQYTASVSGRLAYDVHNEFYFSTVRGSAVAGRNVFIMRPLDGYGRYGGGGAVREGYWMGFTGMDQPEMRLITERRVDALVAWVNANLPYVSPTLRSVSGGSMGAWGALTYGCRRAHMFASIYADRPRWRYAQNYDAQTANVPNWASGNTAHTVASSPNLLVEDGGGKVVDHMNVIAYAANTANTLPFIAWNIGRNDGFTDFRDHVDAVAALRAAKRGFAFAWNNGNHSTGSAAASLLPRYDDFPLEIGKGYPLFTNHSGDQNPSVDLEGGINIGLRFRNVVESPTGWSCEVTSKLGARTVDVEPLSPVFTAPVAAQTVTIPAANTWVPVSFSIGG